MGFPQTHFSENFLIIQKFQFTKITNFNVSAILKKNAHFWGRREFRWSSSMSIAGSCYCWQRKQLRSSSNNFVDSSWFSCGLLNFCFCWWANIFHLVSDGIKMLMRYLKLKMKAKRFFLNAIIFLSWINPWIKAEKRDPWWPVLEAFRRKFSYFSRSIKKCWGWKVIYYKYTLHYLHHFFICILQCRVYFHFWNNYPQTWSNITRCGRRQGKLLRKLAYKKLLSYPRQPLKFQITELLI